MENAIYALEAPPPKENESAVMSTFAPGNASNFHFHFHFHVLCHVRRGRDTCPDIVRQRAPTMLDEAAAVQGRKKERRAMPQTQQRKQGSRTYVTVPLCVWTAPSLVVGWLFGWLAGTPRRTSQSPFRLMSQRPLGQTRPHPQIMRVCVCVLCVCCAIDLDRKTSQTKA